MDNTATTTKKDNTLHFHSAIKHNTTFRAILAIVGIIFILLYASLAVTVASGELTKGVIIAVYVIAPVAIGYVTIRPILWNLFGEEEIILSPHNIQYRKSFGIFKTKWTVRDYQPLSYEIVDRRTDLDLCVFRIGSKTVMDVPIVLYTTSILLHKRHVKDLVEQYERLADIKLADIPTGTHIA